MPHGSIESTVIDLDSTANESLPLSILAEIGFGATVSGESKELTLSTAGAVNVYPTDDFTGVPATVA
jgi:hypothetical protein